MPENEESGTDMIVAQPLPLTDLLYDGLSQWEKCAAMAQKYPSRAIFWGTINPLEGKKALDAFWKFELPEDLVTGYGYPQLTTQAKKKILGGNLARLMGIDVERKVAELRR